MIDILKIPQPDELTYTPQEMIALRVPEFAYPAAYISGFGGRDFIYNAVNEMLCHVIDDKTREYRFDFFDQLMTDIDLQDSIKSICSELPYQTIFFSGWDKSKLAVRIEKLMNVPDTLEKILELDSDVELVQDLKSYARNFKKNHRKFIGEARLMPQPRDKSGKYIQVNYDKFDDLCIWALNYNPIIEEMGNLRDQLNTYRVFSYLLEFGCKPVITDDPGAFLRGAYHLADAKYKDGGLKNYKFPLPNKIQWNEDAVLTFITGINSGGKSSYLRNIGLNTLLVSGGFYALASSCRMSKVRRIWTAFDFGDRPGMGHLETCQTYISNMLDYVEKHDLILIDEPAEGTEPMAEIELTRGLIEGLHENRLTSFIVTHDIEMVRSYEGMKDSAFLMVNPKYHLGPGIAETGYGLRMAKQLGTDPASIKRRLSRVS